MQLMYTSCGWFFDDIGGIETVQILRYACRTLQLAKELFQEDFEEPFLKILEKAKSNIRERGTGRDIFERYVKPSRVDLSKVAGHYSLSSLFEEYEDKTSIYCYTVEKDDYKLNIAGKSKLAVGRLSIISDVTQESEEFSFVVLYLGDHNLSGGAKRFVNETEHNEFIAQLTAAFEKSDLSTFFRIVDKNFGVETYSLKTLFHDEQRKILDLVLGSTLDEAEAAYRQIYEEHAPLLRFLSDINMPLPKPFYNAAEFSLNVSLKKAIEAEEPDVPKIVSLIDEAKRIGVQLDREGLGFSLTNTVNRMTEKFQFYESELPLLNQLDEILELTSTMPFPVDLWKAQNIFYDMMHQILPAFQSKAEAGDEKARTWIRHFTQLSEKLHVRISL